MTEKEWKRAKDRVYARTYYYKNHAKILADQKRRREERKAKTEGTP